MAEIQFSQNFKNDLLFEALGDVERMVKPFAPTCGSPIEVAFIGAFCYFAKIMGSRAILGGSEEAPAEGKPFPFDVFPQCQIDKYRVDFLIGYRERHIVVECDGRDYHHSTREQIERDRERDAFLLGLGHKVVRYPGRQIDSEPFRCAADVFCWLVHGEFLYP